ncbi:uncharacterized protein PG986_011863 [Apiospora aurea]|uniref:SWI5-dependent HO expression protein 3 n=1 Tax=Apiospora aurea TaxID=335848 RepID=A0ABR1PYD6_9PEZI
MSRPLPDDEEWRVLGGDESQESLMYSTQPFSQHIPHHSDWDKPQYVQVEHSQLENDSVDMESMEKHQLEQQSATTGIANTGASIAGLGNLITRPHFVDPQQEVNNTFTFSQYDPRKSSQQLRSDPEASSATAVAGGDGLSSAQMGVHRISNPHPKDSPLPTREPSTKKTSTEMPSESVRLAPAISRTPMQCTEDVNTRDQQGNSHEHDHMHHYQSPNQTSPPEEPHSDNTEGRDEANSLHERGEPQSQGVRHSSDLQRSAIEQHERQSGSTNTSSSYAIVEKPSRSRERHHHASSEMPASVKTSEGLEKHASSDSGDASINNSTPTRPGVKARQHLGGEKCNVGLQIESSGASRSAHGRSLEPGKHANNVANPRAERQRPDGPRDLVFEHKRQEKPRPRHEPVNQSSRQPSRAHPGRRYPATPAMARPLRAEPVQNPLGRPTSASSNVSKRRAPQVKTVPAKRSGVEERLNNDFRGLTDHWNSYFNSLGEYRDDVHAELETLQQQVEEQTKEIEGCHDTMQSQSQIIDRTTAERDEWAEQAEQERRRADSSASKMQRLHGKCQEFKTQLNAATEEHQKLYRRNREMILAAQKEQESKSERIQQEVAKIRADIHASVIEVSKEAQEQIARLNEETSTLRVQLDERQKDLSDETNIAAGLRNELEQARLLLTQNVQTLTSQNEKIVKTLSELTQDGLHISLSEQTHTLETILKSVEGVRVSNHGAIADLAQSLKNDFFKEVAGAIKEGMTSNQPITAADKDALTDGIGSIQELCDHIYNQVRDDQHSQNVQYMYQESQSHIQMLEERLQEILEQWEQAESWNFEFGQENEELQAEIVLLGEEKKELQIEANTTQALNDENYVLMGLIERQQEKISANSDLEEQVASLEATITSLESEAEVNQYLEDQVACLEDQIAEKDKIIQKSDKVSKQLEESLEKAVQRSRGTEQRLRDDRLELQERLQSTEEERSRLENDLEVAKEKIQELSSARSSEETQMRNLRDKMDVQNATIEKFAKEVQTTQHIQEQLKASLKDWVKDYKDIENMKKLFEQIDWSRMENAASATDLMEERIRRVVVQSPMPMGEEADEPPPPSVEQERESRRQAVPPKSIMRVTRASAKNEAPAEAPEDSTDPQPMPEKPLVSNHSMYNRPVQGVPNDSAHDPLSSSQKRARSSSVPSDTGLENDVEHANKRARSGGPAGADSSNGIQPKLSQSMDYTPQDSEHGITEKNMSIRTFEGNLRGPLQRRTSSLVTYGSKDSTSSSYADSHGASQVSIASSQTLSQGSLDSQLPRGPSRTEGPSQGQSQGQLRTLPFKHRHSKQ